MNKSTIDINEYSNIHAWIRYHYGKPTHCEQCGLEGKKVGRWSIEWALKRGKAYAKDRECFISLCPSCHRKYDWGEFCAQGHLYTPENTYIFSDTRRICKICRKETQKEYRNNHPEEVLLKSRVLKKDKNYQALRVQKGICANCPNPLVTTILCDPCRIKKKEADRKYRLKLKNQEDFTTDERGKE